MKELEEIMEMSKRAKWETEVLQKANNYMKDLQQENTKLKEQIDELIKWLDKEIIYFANAEVEDYYAIGSYNNGRIAMLREVLSKLKGSDIK